MAPSSLSMALTFSLGLVCSLVLTGCAQFKPTSLEKIGFMERAQSATQESVTVSTAVLSDAETTALLGFDLNVTRPQAVWVKVENKTEQIFVIPSIALDPDYYPPLELAWKGHGWVGSERNLAIDQHLHALNLPRLVRPGETVSGFVFTQHRQGAKFVNIELIGEEGAEVLRFGFLIELEEFQGDYERIAGKTLYEEETIVELPDAQALIDWVAQLPPAVKGGDRETDGDPLNIVLIGSTEDVFSALVRQGWSLTESTRVSSVIDTIGSAVLGANYQYSPVSSLYLFDRKQDIALQKARGNVNQRNHMRLWRAPVYYKTYPVWVGQISRDIGVRLSYKTITTHKIDPDVDEARWYLLQDLYYSQSMDAYGFAPGVGKRSLESPGRNYTGDPYFTDGRRLILLLTKHPVAVNSIERLDITQTLDNRPASIE